MPDDTPQLDQAETAAVAEGLALQVDAAQALATLALDAETRGIDPHPTLDVVDAIVATAQEFAATTGTPLPVTWEQQLAALDSGGLGAIGGALAKKIVGRAAQWSGAALERIGLRDAAGIGIHGAEAAAIDAGKLAAKEGTEAAAAQLAARGMVLVTPPIAKATGWTAGKVLALTAAGGAIAVPSVVAAMGYRWTERYAQAEAATRIYHDALQACADSGSPEVCDRIFAAAAEAQAATAKSIEAASPFTLGGIPAWAIVAAGLAALLLLRR